jgi:hypothetical protein
MNVKWGSYSFGSNACRVQASSETVLNDGGQPIAVRRSLAVDGFLQGDGQAELAQSASALATALARPYQDLVLFRDDGSPSDTALYNAGSLTGVSIEGLDFPGTDGGEYATYRRFRFTASAEYPLTSSAKVLVSFTESLTFSGGGPIYRHRPALNGKPQKQLIYPHSIFRATQAGEAVGFLATPQPPRALWPTALVEDPEITHVSPTRRGRLYTDFVVRWKYSFESAEPLIGSPTLWK